MAQNGPTSNENVVERLSRVEQAIETFRRIFTNVFLLYAVVIFLVVISQDSLKDFVRGIGPDRDPIMIAEDAFTYLINEPHTQSSIAFRFNQNCGVLDPNTWRPLHEPIGNQFSTGDLVIVLAYCDSSSDLRITAMRKSPEAVMDYYISSEIMLRRSSLTKSPQKPAAELSKHASVVDALETDTIKLILASVTPKDGAEANSGLEISGPNKSNLDGSDEFRISQGVFPVAVLCTYNLAPNMLIRRVRLNNGTCADEQYQNGRLVQITSAPCVC